MPLARALPPMRPSATAAAFLPSSVIQVLNLASRNPADHDGVADGVGRALSAFRASGLELLSSD
jgi:hypothetical protein